MDETLQAKLNAEVMKKVRCPNHSKGCTHPEHEMWGGRLMTLNPKIDGVSVCEDCFVKWLLKTNSIEVKTYPTEVNLDENM